MSLKAEQDGITHCNIYSKGATPLGRLLSNFARTPFVHPTYGRFKSMEGFWYWLKTGRQHNDLKELYGYHAKERGKTYSTVPMPELEFREEVCIALGLKIEQTPKLPQLLAESDLPLVHYYVYHGKIVDRTKAHQWQIDFIESVRNELKEYGL